MFHDIRRSKKSLREVLPHKKSGAEPTPEPRLSRSRPRHHARGGWGWAALALVLGGATVGVYFFSQRFAVASVELSPRRLTIDLAGTTATLPFETITLAPVSATKKVATVAGSTEVKKASGRIIVHNEHSSTPQTLVTRTRFEAPDGKIYRIAAPLSVPGSKVVGGKTVPGTVEAIVYAEEAGPAYNLDLNAATKLTIPGFKGDPRYAKFYATLKTPLAGGSAGEGRVVPEATKTQVNTALKAELTRRVAEQIRFQLPADYVFYDAGVKITFSEKLEPAVGGTADERNYVLTASTEALIFDRETLSAALLESKLPTQFAGAPFLIKNLEALALKPTVAQAGAKTASVLAAGEAEVLLVIDEAALRQALLGLEKSASTAIFADFPAIEQARVIFRPPWAGRFPEATEKIKFQVAGQP